MLSLNLSACERIGDYVFEKLGMNQLISTIAQDEKAAQLYKALHERNTAQVKALVAANVQQDLQAKPEMIEQLYALIPAEPATSMEIQTTSKSVTTNDGKTTSVSYLYDYPKMTLLFRVVFEGHDGETNIVGFFITLHPKENADAVQPSREVDVVTPAERSASDVDETGAKIIRV